MAGLDNFTWFAPTKPVFVAAAFAIDTECCVLRIAGKILVVVIRVSTASAATVVDATALSSVLQVTFHFSEIDTQVEMVPHLVVVRVWVPALIKG